MMVDHLLADRLLAVGTAGLSSALRKRGYPDSFVDGVRPLAEGMRFAGTARTLRLVAFRPDLFEKRGGGFNPQKQAFDGVDEGEVLVIEARGVKETGTLGDILALRANSRGAAGVVTDGGVRDSEVVGSIGLPVFARNPHPGLLGHRHVPWDTDVVITCGGTSVVPGDVAGGDADGVLVIPVALVFDVFVDAEQHEREDAWVAAPVTEGHPLAGLFPMNASWRARYEADLSMEEEVLR